jgi:hypothetical protein
VIIVRSEVKGAESKQQGELNAEEALRIKSVARSDEAGEGDIWCYFEVPEIRNIWPYKSNAASGHICT